MACYHPLKGFTVGETKNGKPKLRVLPYEVKYIDRYGVPVTVDVSPDEFCITEYYELPCGHCLGCRQDQSKEWANRLLLEMQYTDSAYFITLTYDNEHIHPSYDAETGLCNGLFTLDKRDIQLFIKRLRKRFENDKIRYYIAGEYGDNTARPHYHGILFGLHIDDLKECGRSETGNKYFISESIAEVWKNGFVSVEPANYATCKYVASYVTKKIGIRPNQFYEDNYLVPPFSLSSRRPGIGYKYLEDHPDYWKFDEINLTLPDGGRKFPLPRYFKKKFKEMLPEEYEKVAKRHEQAAKDRKEMILDNTNLDYLDYLKNMEQKHEEKLKARNKI